MRALWVMVVVGCSPARFTEMVPMRDGTRLATDVHLPPGVDRASAVLVRTPYGRSDVALLAPGLNAAGAVVVAQDLRGRFDSEGVDRVFTTDGAGALQDGVDTLAWIVDQPWSSGLVGTYGDSAEGIVQYLTAAADPEGLAVMHAGVATPDLYTDAMFQGGVRRYALSHNWLEEQGSLHFEAELERHPFLDDFWDSSESSDQVAAVDVPAVHQGGWFDIFLDGTIRAFTGAQTRGGEGARGRQKLVVGPWTHAGGWSADQGELQFPDNAAQSPAGSFLDVMFDHYLQLEHPGIDGHPDDLAAVHYYTMGDVDDPAAPGNEWRTADAWPPPAAAVRLHLQAGGGLAEACPAPEPTTAYVFDPSDPAPTICGPNLTLEAGPCDQRPVEARADVVVFETVALPQPLEITGPVTAHLFVGIDQPDADVVVRLSDVYPDGRSMGITEGVLRLATRGSQTSLSPLAPEEVVHAEVDLWHTSLVLAPGHRLRVAITSSSWPRYAVNQHNGLPYPASVQGEGPPVAVQLHHDEAHASYLELPDPTRSPDSVIRCDP